MEGQDHLLELPASDYRRLQGPKKKRFAWKPNFEEPNSRSDGSSTSNQLDPIVISLGSWHGNCFIPVLP